MASVGASFGDQDAELLKVIKHEVVVDLQGRPASPELRKLIEIPVQIIVTEAVTQN